MTEYIKKEDALKMCSGEIQDIRYMTDVSGKRYECVVGARRINADEIAEQIKKIPSADVRPVVRGKWRLYSPLTDTYECDKCGYQVIDESFRTNYCPDCGAMMEES